MSADNISLPHLRHACVHVQQCRTPAHFLSICPRIPTGRVGQPQSKSPPSKAADTRTRSKTEGDMLLSRTARAVQQTRIARQSQEEQMGTRSPTHKSVPEERDTSSTSPLPHYATSPMYVCLPIFLHGRRHIHMHCNAAAASLAATFPSLWTTTTPFTNLCVDAYLSHHRFFFHEYGLVSGLC
jgi:hypothetical protein